jgi:hypothetical protein
LTVAVEPPRGVLVLGMHRSGTSVATRLVHMLGLSASTDQIGPTSWNPRGLWESQSLIGVNDRLLVETGHTWWYPPPDEPRYAEAMLGLDRFDAAARDAFATVHPRSPWAWKDPRTSLLLPFWRRVLGEVAGFVVLRHPVDVARSIERRNALPLPFALALWERYNRLILRHSRDVPLLVLRYDDFLDDGERSVLRIHAFLHDLGLSPARESHGSSVIPESSVDRSLRHSHVPADGLSVDPAFGSALELYARLGSLLTPSSHLGTLELPPEGGWVSEVLSQRGPQRPPPWRDPSD